jgi:hypothetical protein
LEGQRVTTSSRVWIHTTFRAKSKKRGFSGDWCCCWEKAGWVEGEERRGEGVGGV